MVRAEIGERRLGVNVPDAAIGLAVAALILWPLTRTDLPLLYDYPNHLARMRILSDPSPDLAAMYARHWALYPNLAMDLIVPALGRVLPLLMAGRMFIGLVMLLCVAGPVALHRAAFGGRSPWPWVVAQCAFNGVLQLGMLNYLAGVGCAFLAAAAMLRAGAWGVFARVTMAAGFGVACLLCHLFGFALFALLLASSEAEGLIEDFRTRRVPWRLAPVLAAIAVPLALYLAFGPAQTYASADALGTAWTQIADGALTHLKLRVLWALGAFAAPGGPFHLISAGVLGAIVVWAAGTRRLAVARGLLPALAVLCALWLLLPEKLADEGLMYKRLGLPLVLLGITAVSPRLTWPEGAVAGAVCAGLLAAISVSAAGNWTAQGRMLADVREVIADLPPRTRVLGVRDGVAAWRADDDEPAEQRGFYRFISYGHLPALVTLDRAAFWPMLFAQAGKQPIEATPAFAALTQDDGYLPLTSQLGDAAPDQAQMVDWRSRYDYVLRLNAHPAALPDPALREVARSGFAALYRVAPPLARAARPPPIKSAASPSE